MIISGQFSHIIVEENEKEEMIMEQEGNRKKRKTANMNDELETVYNNPTAEKSKQPDPQPKDYEEVEY